VPTDPARYTNLLPETTYHVDGRYEITTDAQARVRTMEIHDIDLDSAAPPRSDAQQRNATDLGRLESRGQARWNGAPRSPARTLCRDGQPQTLRVEDCHRRRPWSAQEVVDDQREQIAGDVRGARRRPGSARRRGPGGGPARGR
jgi:hypothetical protein